MPRVRMLHVLISLVAVATLMIADVGSATSLPPEWTSATKDWYEQPRSDVPEDRHALAGGCYVMGPADGAWTQRSGDGFAATAAGVEQAEPFFFKATDLGSYMIYGTKPDFIAASEGALGQAARGAAGSHPGAIAGGVVFESTDEVAEQVATSEANRRTGRGDAVVAAKRASDLADWTIDEAEGGFVVDLPALDRSLGVDANGRLDLVDRGQGTIFGFQKAEGCAEFPEIEVNVDGPVVGGQTSFQEVRGYFDAHLHMMAFEFLGGRARCGRPWHRFGVEHALVDCPDHKPDGFGAVLESVLQKRQPDGRHNTDGWPTFEGWPKYNSYTHEQVYYKWLERAWRGGLRLFTNLLVDNNQLCKIYPYKSRRSVNTDVNSNDPTEGGPRVCNEMDSVRLQAKRLREFQDYIDAQSGGPGEGWFRIVTDPFEAREVINDGKLAVVLGIEVSVPLDCGETLEVPRCDLTDVNDGLDEVYDLGVRQMELVNKFDNALSGVAGDEGTTGAVVNQGNLLETGHYWKMETCTEQDGDAHDKRQLNFEDDAVPGEFKGRDPLVGAILALAGPTGAAPLYPKGPHCNTIGLSDLGEAMIKGLAERGMIFDPDHMSARAQTEALEYVTNDPEVQGLPGEPGIVSSHGWANDSIYRRIYDLGGVVTPYAGSSAGFVEQWSRHRQWADPRYYFGFGYGADTNGFGSQGGPRAGTSELPAVSYPFEGFGGVQVSPQRSGTKTYDFAVDGVAHYGMYADWIEDLRILGGQSLIDDMLRGPEAYLQMWERAAGIAPDACRSDVEDLTQQDFDSLRQGMSAEEVLTALGQPSIRVGEYYTYCIGDQTATLQFTPDGLLSQWGSGDQEPEVVLPKPNNPDHPKNGPDHPHSDPNHPRNDPDHPRNDPGHPPKKG